MIDTRTLRVELANWITAGGDITAYPRYQGGTLPAAFVNRPDTIRQVSAGLDELVIELLVAVGNPAHPEAQDELVELALKVGNRFKPAELDLSEFTAARTIRLVQIGDFEESTLGSAPVLTASLILSIIA